MIFDNKRKELESKLEIFEEAKRNQEAKQREAHEQHLVELFVTSAQNLSMQLMALEKTLKGMMEPLNAVVEAINGLNSMQDGLTAMVKQSADQLDQFNKAVEILERSMSPTEQDYTEYAEETQEGRDRVQRAEVREMMRKGISPEQARARMRERDIYDQMVKGR